MESKQAVPLRDLFLVFAKIGAFTIGGGYAMILLIREEIIRRGWISEEEFPDILVLVQSAPGLLAVNISIFTGYKIRGTRGSVVATLGSCLPSFLIILLIAMFFTGYQDVPAVVSIFQGIRPAVVALIAVPMLKMAKESNHSVLAWSITAVTLGLIAFLKVSPVYVLLVSIAVAVGISWWREHREGLRK